MGVYHSVLLNPNLFQTKKCHLPWWFSDLVSQIHTHFLAEIMPSLLRLVLRFLKIHFKFAYFFPIHLELK